MLSRLSLRYRIALIIFILEVCMLSIVLGIMLRYSAGVANTFDREARLGSFSLLSSISVAALLTREYSDIQLYFDHATELPAIDAIVLSDWEKRVVASSKVELIGKNLSALKGTENKNWEIHPIKSGSSDIGTLAIEFSETGLIREHEHARNQSIFMALAGMLVIAVVGIFTGYSLTRRLHKIETAARRIANGEIYVRSKVTGKDEIAQLSSSVDRMADAAVLERSKLVKQAAKISLLLDSTAEGIYGVDTQCMCTFANASCLKMLGYSHEDELIGKNIHELTQHIHPNGKPYPEEESPVRDSIMYGNLSHADNEVYWRVDGSAFPVEYWSHPIFENEQLVGAVVTFIDITDRRAAKEEIQQLAFYDPLTNLPNRRLLMDRLLHAIASSKRNHQYCALLFLDLDNFKILNDTQGHDVGDLLLVEVTQRLKTCIREGDTIARFGGDEFVIILEGLSTDTQAAASQAESISEKIRTGFGQSFKLKNLDHHCSVSIGINMFIDHAGSPEELLKQADLAMYQSKQSGRNTIRFFDPAMQEALNERGQMELALRKAIENQQFRLHYQIQVDSTLRPIGAEVLLRWQHPERGLVMPDDFIPITEDSGLILSIGQWVLEQTCEQIRLWQSNPIFKDIKVAVNVSVYQFHHDEFFDQVKEALEKSGIDPGLLKLELTESLILNDVEDSIEKMQQLKAIGVDFSMDDFGTGYSSLSYLKKLPIDQIKIDQSFVNDIGTDKNDEAIVKTIIAMADILGMKVLAEGVETEVQHNFLKSHGCSAFQGFLFSEALPVGQFEKLLQKSLEKV